MWNGILKVDYKDKTDSKWVNKTIEANIVLYFCSLNKYDLVRLRKCIEI